MRGAQTCLFPQLHTCSIQQHIARTWRVLSCLKYLFSNIFKCKLKTHWFNLVFLIFLLICILQLYVYYLFCSCCLLFCYIVRLNLLVDLMVYVIALNVYATFILFTTLLIFLKSVWNKSFKIDKLWSLATMNSYCLALLQRGRRLKQVDFLTQPGLQLPRLQILC